MYYTVDCILHTVLYTLYFVLYTVYYNILHYTILYCNTTPQTPSTRQDASLLSLLWGCISVYDAVSQSVRMQSILAKLVGKIDDPCDQERSRHGCFCKPARSAQHNDSRSKTRGLQRKLDAAEEPSAFICLRRYKTHAALQASSPGLLPTQRPRQPREVAGPDDSVALTVWRDKIVAEQPQEGQGTRVAKHQRQGFAPKTPPASSPESTRRGRRHCPHPSLWARLTTRATTKECRHGCFCKPARSVQHNDSPARPDACSGS